MKMYKLLVMLMVATILCVLIPSIGVWSEVNESKDVGRAEKRISASALEKIRSMRKQMAQRKRRIIFNNDGDDIFHYSSEPSPKAILKPRMNHLLNSQVDCVFYSTHASFGAVNHRTKVGFNLKAREGKGKSVVQSLAEQGTDSIEIMLNFCKENNIEFFWSMRMNDTHDALYEQELWRLSQFKVDHPDCVIGTSENKPQCGRWTAVDFAQPEVREMSFRLLEEVCQNYDIDGIELDFFRWLSYFKSVAYGGTASQDECDMMTDLIRRIRTMTEEEGVKRGRPYLVAVRVPDSTGYCKAIGLEIERWLQEGLVDILIPGGDHILNPMRYGIELGHKYNVKVYPDLDGVYSASVSGGFNRNGTKTWRARAMTAWQEGADGIYTFNWYNTYDSSYREMGDLRTLEGLDKNYFVDVMGRKGIHRENEYLTGGERFINFPALHLDNHLFLSSKEFLTLPIVVGDDLEKVKKMGKQVKATCNIWVPRIKDLDQIDIRLNGVELKEGSLSDEWLRYPLDPSLIKKGENLFDVRVARPDVVDAKEELWDLEYVCDKKLVAPYQYPWRRLFDNSFRVEKIKKDKLLLADFGTGKGDMSNFTYPWQIRVHEETVLETKVKVLSTDDPLGVCVRVANGVTVEYLSLQEDSVGLHFAGLSLPMDTTDKYHTYRLVFKDKDIKLYVDGTLKLDGTGHFTTPIATKEALLYSPYTPEQWLNVKAFLFGSATDPGTGAAYWKYIRYRTESHIIKDLVLSLRFNNQK
jgi:Glycosyl hydrolase-like 10